MIEALLAICLATFGWSYRLVNSYGPGNIISRFRNFIGIRYDDNGNRYSLTTIGDLFNCELCLSVWLSIPITTWCALSWYLFKGAWLIYPLAASGLVALVESYNDRQSN
jgi:hypothetical protein